ncbi:MAG: (Fe-S)-binding protein [Halothiobacillaceae bacterium]
MQVDTDPKDAAQSHPEGNVPPAREALADANACVMCGLCLPHCPTYGLERNEADGPRGRLSLMLGLHREDLAIDDQVTAHLDACLGCRACEQMCPSNVPYGRLIDSARQVLREEGFGQTTARQWRDRLLTHRGRMTLAVGAQVLADRVGLGRLTRRLAGPAAAALPTPLPWPAHPFGIHRAKGSERGRLGLFVGCMGTSLDADTTRAAIRVLVRLGWSVVVPRSQGCCGAMHRHDGAADTADHLLAESIASFADTAVDQAVGLSTACVAEWREQAAGQLPIVELTDFLARENDDVWPALLSAENRSAAIHLPCSQRNALRDTDAAERLLRRIPALKIEPLAGNALCCGAAGLQRLSHPEQARALREPKLDALEARSVDYLVSTNVGCTMHLNVGLAERNRKLRATHPVVLLARYLKPG